MRIGVDVGGTHTDAVVMDGEELVAATKALTSEDIASGVISAVQETLKQSGVAPSAIQMITIGTTQFTNAVVARRGLAPAAVIRIGAQSSSALPFAAKWPADLVEITIGPTAMIDGGHNYDGGAIVPTDMVALEQAIDAIAASQVNTLAISGVFATSNPSAEQMVAARVLERIPDIDISQSHELGRIGIYQRENATILNAALKPLAKMVVAAFEEAFSALALSCPLFMSQNDGTLMASAYAQDYPVFTFSSGPTNSMRGAAYLTGAKDAMVVDIGGTTSDIGMLIDGFPRPSGSAVYIGGVLTNFRMPDVLATALGGGTVISDDGATIGPQSVGRDLPHKGRVFGGDTLTATDIAVAASRADIGDHKNVENIPIGTIDAALGEMKSMLERGIDRMKTSAEPLPLIVVGGGGFLTPDNLDGASNIIRPRNAGVANAIGAAFAQVGGEGDAIYTASTRPREAALNAAKEQASQRAANAGAKESSISIVEVEETPMSYMDEPGAVIRAKAVGDVDLARVARGAPTQ